MKKVIISLITFILILNIVSSQELSYEGWVYSNKMFDFDSVSYKTLLSSDGTKLNLLSDSNFLIDLGDCKTEKYRKYCFNTSTYDTSIQEYKAYIYLYYLKPELEITRVIDDFILETDEVATFDVRITNTGDEDAQDIEYYEDFPSSLKITRSKGCDIIDNSIKWTGDLEIGETKDFEYSIESVGSVDQYFKAKLSYFNGVEDIEQFSDQIRIYSQSILDIEHDTSSEEYQINEEIEFTLTLLNNGEKKLEDINLNLYIPQSINVIKHSTSFDYIEDKLVLNTDLDINNTVIYEFTFSGNKEGLAFILWDGDFSYKNIQYEIKSYKQGFVLSNEGVELTTSLDTNENVKSNELLRFYVKLQNKNEYSVLKNVRLQTTTDLASIQDYNYNNVDVNQSIYLINTELRVPSIETKKNYKIIFNVTYQTHDNEQYSKTIERNVLVEPKKSLEIIPTLSKTKIDEKENIEVKVKINNPSDNDLNSIVYKTFIPNELRVLGVTSSFIQLNATESKDILTFTLVPNLVDKETKFILNFTAIYSDNDGQYQVTEIKEFTVSPKIPDIKIEKSLGSSSVQLGELVDVTYTISNEDTVSVENIVLTSTQDESFDTLYLFETQIPRLDPGEKVVIDGEKIRPKKIGTIHPEGSIIFFVDENNRQFNQTPSSVSLNVADDIINEAALNIQVYGPESINLSQEYEYYINFTNIGRQVAKIIVNGQDEYITKNKIIKQSHKFQASGSQTIKKIFFEYGYLNTVTRAFANDLTVNVIKKNTTNKNDLNKTLNQENQSSNKQNLTDESNSTIIGQNNNANEGSFFAKIYRWFKNLFTLNPKK
jgi:hypothetical protein